MVRHQEMIHLGINKINEWCQTFTAQVFLLPRGLRNIWHSNNKKASIEDVLYTFSFPLKHNDAPF